MNCRCVGIILFNPDMKRLIECIITIQNKVDSIILIENWSINASDILKEYNIKNFDS